MKNILSLLLALLLLVGCIEQPTQDISKEGIENPSQIVVDNTEDVQLIASELVRVVDGDTIIAKLPNGEEEHVRLLLIDTPESVHPSKPVQPFGVESSDFAKEMMPVGSTVYLELDESERDRYDRLLAYVWVGDQMFNELILAKGLARVAYVYPPNTRHVKRFYEVEEKAKQEKLGIWSIENYVTDQGFNEDILAENTEVVEVAAASCTDPDIKGNHSSSGEFIYHVPGGQYYERTNAVEMFCSEEDAVAAGYRKSKR